MHAADPDDPHFREGIFFSEWGGRRAREGGGCLLHRPIAWLYGPVRTDGVLTFILGKGPRFPGGGPAIHAQRQRPPVHTRSCASLPISQNGAHRGQPRRFRGHDKGPMRRCGQRTREEHEEHQSSPSANRRRESHDPPCRGPRSRWSSDSSTRAVGPKSSES